MPIEPDIIGKYREYVARAWVMSSRSIADDLDRAPGSATDLRASLLKSGIIYAPARGDVALTVPPMAAWVRDYPA